MLLEEVDTFLDGGKPQDDLSIILIRRESWSRWNDRLRFAAPWLRSGLDDQRGAEPQCDDPAVVGVSGAALSGARNIERHRVMAQRSSSSTGAAPDCPRCRRRRAFSPPAPVKKLQKVLDSTDVLP
jgi:hypothetical protein